MGRRGAKQRAPRGTRAPGADAGRQLVKMSELAKRSGVPVPTIKHYIREGLLPGPEVRTSRNMAYYDARLASRIRVIKELQAGRFLPLRVIGERLEPSPSDRIRADRDAAPAAPPAPAVTGDPPSRRRGEVMKQLGLRRAELEALEQAGVLEPRGEGEAAGYGGADLALLEILAEGRRLGELFPPSVAEPYLAAVRRLVEVEAELLRRALAGPPGPPERVRQVVALGERLIVALRAKLLPALLEPLEPLAAGRPDRERDRERSP